MWYFFYRFSDWSVLRSNEILFIVIDSCFNQFIPSNGVISSFLVISIGDLVDDLLSSTVTLVLPMNLISFLFTSWYLFFIGLNSLMSCILWSYGMFVTGEPVSMISLGLLPSSSELSSST